MLTINNTLDGYLKNVEIKGNTIQGTDLADIRSVGDKLEGQDLYEIPLLCTSKNLFNPNQLENGSIVIKNGKKMVKYIDDSNNFRYQFKFENNKQYVFVTTMYRDEADSGKNIYAKLLYGDGTSTQFTINDGVKRTIVSDGTKTLIGISGVYNHAKPVYIDLSVTQIEEGTVATSFESHKSHELTISSPCQLGKNDKIYYDEEEQAWCVLKYETRTTMSNFTVLDTDPKFYHINVSVPNVNVTVSVVCNKISSNGELANEGSVALFNDGVILRMYHRQTYATKDDLKNVLGDSFDIIYPCKVPQKIKLPHSQQVILRTFANKTNISSPTKNGVEPTFKGQVAKSKDAVINTHTEQIDNIHQELERVKKLEESTVSVVKNEGKDFVSVEATNGGYFDDVELKGRTLVNLYDYKRQSLIDVSSRKIERIQNGLRVTNKTTYYVESSYLNPSNIKPNTNYTLIWKFKDIQNANNTGLGIGISNSNGTYLRDIVNTVNNNLGAFKFNTGELLANEVGIALRFIRQSTTTSIDVVAEYTDIMILEGDHTQAPPNGYIEGLASVGEGTDEIVVSSVNGDGNLFDGELESGTINASGNGQNVSNSNEIRCANYIRITGCESLTISGELFIDTSSNVLVYYYDSELNYLGYEGLSKGKEYYNLNIKPNAIYIRFRLTKTDLNSKVMINKGTTPKPYVEHKSDKKRLLFYNPTTQAWEKPILREWDSVEKHSDGKYYYHKRSEKVVLNGGENGWSATSVMDNTRMYLIDINNAKISGLTMSNIFKSTTSSLISSTDEEGVALSSTANRIVIRASKTKGNTTDEFKTWLASNNVTIVYQLATEQVFECTNIDLITYPNETNLTVKSGVLVPNITAKYHGTIMNVLNTLMKKVSVLENDYKNYKTVQNRIQLNSTYSADRVTFRVDTAYASATRTVSLDNDLFMLMKSVVSVGKDNYDRVEIESMLDFYVEIGKFDYEMWDVIWILMEIQHNPPVEETPEI